LKLTGPQPVVLVEGVLVCHGLQTSDLLLLGKDFCGDIVKNRLHWDKLTRWLSRNAYDTFE